MKRLHVKKIFFTTFLSFLFICNLLTAQSNTETVVIENARKTSYYTDNVSGDEIILFNGNVKISITKNNDLHIIYADTVHFNRKQNMLYAEGSVTLDRTLKGQTEHLTADSLLFNIETQEGIFNGGRFVQNNTEQNSTENTMIVASDLFAKDDSGAIVFKKGALTFCDNPNPHWKIKATRIWILPGNEFAFANALLYVGNIPMMYFPFFYYPKDELVFNPVFGYDDRRGYTIQTTTYFIGRKKIEKDKESDSLFNFMSNSSTQKKQKLEGLILRNLDEDETEISPHTLKFIADYYSNLGTLIGIDGIFQPKNSFLSNLTFDIYLGFSKTLYPFTSNGISIYTPFDNNGEIHKNTSYFMGLKLPFRFKTDFKLSINKPFSLNINIPIISDSYFDSDFLENRKESMNWLDSLLSGNEEEQEDEETITETTSFSWTLNGSYSPKISLLTPYISSFSITPNSSIYFSSKIDDSELSLQEREFSPMKRFFYPSQVKPISLSANISGTIFSYPKVASNVSAKNIPNLTVPKELGGEWKQAPRAKKENITEENITEENITEENIEIDKDNTEEKEETLLDLNLPKLKVTVPNVQKINGLNYSLKYSINPSILTEIAYAPPEFKDSFDWNELKSTFYIFNSPINLTSSLGYRDSFISLSNNFSFTPIIQRHPEYNDEKTKESVEKNDYLSQKMDLSNTNSLSFKPFIFNKYLKNSSLSWNTGIKLIRTEFIGSVEKPEWEYKKPEWDEDSFTNHTLNFNFMAEEGNFFQKLILTTNLPPRVDSYTGSLELGYKNISISGGTGIKQKSAEDETWVKNPFEQKFSASFFDNKLRLTETYSYNLEEKEKTKFSCSITGYNLTLSYLMQNISGYTYSKTTGWKTTNEKEFQPVSLKLGYSTASKLNFSFLDDKIKFSPNFSTELNYDILRPTNSYFTFRPSITLKINNFLDLTFSSDSRNSVIYRYIQNYTDFEPKIPGETNIFKDLINSFAFGNTALRESSGFKLKSLNIALAHELHDWKLTAEFEIEPRIITEDKKQKYDFSPYFSLSVLWKPMDSIKTTIEDEYGTFYLNP